MKIKEVEEIEEKKEIEKWLHNNQSGKWKNQSAELIKQLSMYNLNIKGLNKKK